MDKVQKQRGSIVLYKEERNGADYIRIEYVNSQAVALLLAQDDFEEVQGQVAGRQDTSRNQQSEAKRLLERDCRYMRY